MSSETPPSAASSSSAPAPRRKRRWLTYSLRTLFVVVTLACLAAYQIGAWLQQLRDEDFEQYVISQLEAISASVVRSHDKAPMPPAWFRRLLGNDDFYPAKNVYIGAIAPWAGPLPPATTEHLRWIAKLPALKGVFLAGAITDADLALLSDLRNLEGVYIESDTFTGSGLGHLNKSQRVTSIELSGGELTADGLRSLETFPALQRVALVSSNLNDACMASLGNCTSLEELTLEDGKITDAGLAQLATLRQLKTLGFYCEIAGNALAGLQTVSHLPGLRKLYLNNRAIHEMVEQGLTDEGFRKLFPGVESPDALRHTEPYRPLDKSMAEGVDSSALPRRATQLDQEQVAP